MSDFSLGLELLLELICLTAVEQGRSWCYFVPVCCSSLPLPHANFKETSVFWPTEMVPEKRMHMLVWQILVSAQLQLQLLAFAAIDLQHTAALLPAAPQQGKSLLELPTGAHGGLVLSWLQLSSRVAFWNQWKLDADNRH